MIPPYCEAISAIMWNCRLIRLQIQKPRFLSHRMMMPEMLGIQLLVRFQLMQKEQSIQVEF